MGISQPSSGIAKYFYLTGGILFTGILINLGSSLFVPLGYAFFISIILYPICRTMENKGIRREAAIAIGLILVTLFIVLLLVLFGTELQKIFSEWPIIRTKLTELFVAIMNYLSEKFGFSDVQMQIWIDDALNNTFNLTFGSVGTTLQSLVVNLAIVALIPVYTFLILFYRKRLVEMLYLILPGYQKEKIAEVIQLSVGTYFKFVKGMFVVYAIVGTLNSLGLWLLGVPYPFLFGYLTAIMTFIPYIGIIVASILPITYAWATYGVIWYPLGVVSLFAFVQYLEANIIFPWAVGQRLELNTLATLIVIVIGGIVLGASGMILIVPFAAILKLIADRMPGWEALSIFLGNSSKN